MAIIMHTMPVNVCSQKPLGGLPSVRRDDHFVAAGCGAGPSLGVWRPKHFTCNSEQR